MLMIVRKGKLTLLMICLLFIIVQQRTIQVDGASQVNPIYGSTCDFSKQEQCEEQFICVKGSMGNESRCLSCLYSEQCEGYPINVCSPTVILVNDSMTGNVTELSVNQCKRRSMFPTHWRDMTATALCFFGGAMAASSGIGAGGLFVPILLLVAGYTPQFAVPLSTVMIFGASISNFLILLPQRHPKADRPIIDYTTALILEPIILCGTTIGIMLNVVLPNWVLVILLLFILLFTSVRTFTRGLKVLKSEKMARVTLAQIYNEDPDLAFFPKSEYVAEKTKNQAINEIESELMNEEVSLISKNEKQLIRHWRKLEKIRFPLIIWFLLIVAWSTVLVISILKGSGKSPSVIGVVECSPGYWTLQGVQYPILLIISGGVAAFVHYQHRLKVKLDYQFEEGDIEWKLKNAILLPIMFLSAGVVAGLLGIGGGIVTGPLLLELGMLPQVAVATSTFMIFFTASSTVGQFAFLGALPWDFSLWFIGLGILSGLTGQFIISFLIKKLNRYSWVIFLTSILMATSALLMGGIGIYSSVIDFKQGKQIGFRPLCA